MHIIIKKTKNIIIAKYVFMIKYENYVKSNTAHFIKNHGQQINQKPKLIYLVTIKNMYLKINPSPNNFISKIFKHI